MSSLVHRRCLHHADREAVARCPECARFFCRECISEYDDRILCTACLGKLVAPAPRSAQRFESLWLVGQSVLAVVIIWFFFFLIGRALLAIPASFHEGKIWQIEAPE